ncbi:methylase [Paenibacillus sp. GCM10027626]|uniref:methylase n=1 Tax=Paenibacillus sp. GCM10027626 TaxID=3273411 RepID=UPI00363E0ADD
MMKAYEQAGVAMTCRGFDEYLCMFDLTEEQLLQGSTLDIAAGGASFTAEAAARGCSATAVDPRYGKERAAWIAEARAEIETSTGKLAALKDQFDWTYYGDLERHRECRLASIEKFAAHCTGEQGRNCYVSGSLPDLPFVDDSFDRVLCSHFLFLYAAQFDVQFHLQSIAEMMRVSRQEVLIYPVQTLQMEQYPHLEQVMEEVRRFGGKSELFKSTLPFIPGSEYGLKIKLL